MADAYAHRQPCPYMPLMHLLFAHLSCAIGKAALAGRQAGSDATLPSPHLCAPFMHALNNRSL
eukprot:scaffold159578_cov21-Tisochrysis_lutea.AAC.2